MTEGRRLLIVVALLAASIVACDSAAPSTAPPSAASAPAVTASAAPTSVETSPASEPAMTVGPVETGPAGTPPCALSDLKASHGFVDEDADSRLTEVVLVSAETCSVDAFPAVGLRDASGSPLVDSPSSGLGAIDLVPGVAYMSQVRLANWCADEPAFPLALALVMGDEELAVTGGSFPEEGGLPVCGAGADPVLEASAWLPTP
jgi:hypothetical protein